MKVQSIEFLHLDVPFTAHTHQHMQYWLPHFRIFRLCKVVLANGIVGWGETMPNYTAAPPRQRQCVEQSKVVECGFERMGRYAPLPSALETTNQWL